MAELDDSVRTWGGIPLVWSGATAGDTCLHFAAALSPIMVALCSGQPVVRVPARSPATRMAAGGTIGQTLEGGRVVVWGSGCAPRGPGENRSLPPDTELLLRATCGPYSRALLGGGGPACVYGDPAWLLPWFYRPTIARRWDLGVVLHPSELQERTPQADRRAESVRHAIPADLAGRVRLINPLAPAGAAGLRDKIDEMLACRRIVSTGLHAMVLAETYGIPCLHFAPAGPAPGCGRLPTTPDGGLDLRLADFYAGLRVSALPVYVQESGAATDWEAVLRAVDKAWSPVWLREDDLLDSFPLPVSAVAAPPGGTVFDHPLVQALALGRDIEAPPPAPARADTVARPAARAVPGLKEWVAENGVVPLSWAATSPAKPHPNLGDALSAAITATMAGLPVQRRKFQDRGERLAAVGTIGHVLRGGVAHWWGTALDAKRNAFDPAVPRFCLPPDTRFVVHATRGRFTAARLRGEGVPAPAVYGDPVWFLPRLMTDRPVTPQYELGVVLHISELEEPRPGAPVLASYRRYDVPPSLARSVRIIDTFTGQGLGGLLDKVDEIRACRRIASISFHGLVIAEAFGIPNVWFKPSPGGPQVLDVEDETADIDHRVRDWYSGTSKLRLPVYGSDRLKPTDWDELISWIDSNWTGLSTDAAGLFDAFPLPVRVSLQDAAWPIAPEVAESLRTL